MLRKNVAQVCVILCMACSPEGISEPYATDDSSPLLVSFVSVPEGSLTFLPPIGPSPKGGGEIDPNLSPTVRITGPHFVEELSAGLNSDGDLYIAEWKTTDSGLAVGSEYELSVTVGRWELGTARVALWGGRVRKKSLPAHVYPLKLGSTLPIKFRIAPGAIPVETAVVSGTITVEGLPVAGVTVSLEGPESAQIVSASDGTFEFTGLLAGGYRVLIGHWPEEYVFSEVEELISVLPDETVIVDFVGEPASPWARMEIPAGTQGLFAVWGLDSEDVFVVGDRVALHFDGTEWTPQPVPENAYELKAVWGFASDDVWSVSYSNILHFDGTTWDWVARIEDENFSGIWGASPTEIYAVGAGGGIFRFDGSSWESESLGTDVWLRAVHGAGELTMTVSNPEPGGDFGYIWAREASSWEPSPGNPIWGPGSIWAVSETLAFAAGEVGLAQFDGQSWSRVSEPVPSGFIPQGGQALWARSEYDVIIVGQTCHDNVCVPTVLQWDGTTFTNVTPDDPPIRPGTGPIQGVWGSPDGSTVFVVGSEADAQGNNNIGYLYRWRRW